MQSELKMTQRKKLIVSWPDANGAERTILPEAKTRAVVFGSLMRMMTAAKRCSHKQMYLALFTTS